MKQPEFEKLCNDLARIWTRKDGALARLGRCSASVGSHILCIGAKSNTGFAAHYCVVWFGDSKVFEGRLHSIELRKFLTSNHLCYAEVTTSRMLDQNKRGLINCYGSKVSCSNSSCAIHKSTPFQVTDTVATSL